MPWWLESFEWEVSSIGETIDDLSDNLSNLEDFDPTATEIHKPELSDSGITTVLDKFDELADAIDENVGIETERDNSLLSEVFVITDGHVETTDGFVNWLEGLLELCPPFNEELTSLVMVNSNVKVEAVEGLVPDELLGRLKNIGMINDGKINQRTYHYQLIGSHDSILRELGQLFDIELPTEYESFEMLFYESWASGVQENAESLSKWIERASKHNPGKLEAGEQAKFGLVSLNAPLRISTETPGYTSLNIYASSNSKMGYWRDTGNRRSTINEIMRSVGLIEE